MSSLGTLKQMSGLESGISSNFRALTGFGGKSRKKVLAIDLGKWTTKAAVIANTADGIKLVNFHIQPAVELDPKNWRTALVDLFKELHKQVGGDARQLVVSMSMSDVILRNVEMPNAKVQDLRRIVSFSTRSILQQDLVNHYFDCALLPDIESAHRVLVAPAPPPPAPEAPAEAPANGAASPAPETAAPAPAPEPESAPKPMAPPPGKKQMRVLVGATPKQLVDDLRDASAEAGLVLEEVTFTHIGLLNAAFVSLAEQVRASAVALVDIGFRTTSISILFKGELVLTRVVPLGGDQITAGLAKAMEANYRVAEAIKVTLPEKVRDHLQTILTNVGTEIRTAISFFEKQFEVTIGEVYLNGASTRSKFIMESLQRELFVECRTWNPTAGLGMDFSGERKAELEANFAQLASAIGAGHAWLTAPKLRINVLSEWQEEELARLRDPVRWSMRGAAAVVLMMLVWVSLLVVERGRKFVQINMLERKLATVAKGSKAVSDQIKRIGDTEQTLAHLDVQRATRFGWVEPLNALQFIVGDNIQFIRYHMAQVVTYVAAAPAATKPNGTVIPAKPAYATEETVLTITAKNYGDLTAAQKFIQRIASDPYFKTHLRQERPVLLKDQLPQQTDPLNPSKSFSIFTIECFYNQRLMTDE